MQFSERSFPDSRTFWFRDCTFAIKLRKSFFVCKYLYYALLYIDRYLCIVHLTGLLIFSLTTGYCFPPNALHYVYCYSQHTSTLNHQIQISKISVL
jgi:hypothetical protein